MCVVYSIVKLHSSKGYPWVATPDSRYDGKRISRGGPFTSETPDSLNLTT